MRKTTAAYQISLKELFRVLVFVLIGSNTHPLCSEYRRLPSGCRYFLPRCKTNRLRYSFVSTSTALLKCLRSALPCILLKCGGSFADCWLHKELPLGDNKFDLTLLYFYSLSHCVHHTSRWSMIINSTLRCLSSEYIVGYVYEEHGA